jgi:hypothetical protein
MDLCRAAGFAIETDRNEWGTYVERWNGIPIAINDWILDTHQLVASLETHATGGTCSTIYALRFGEGAVCGATNGGIQVERVGTLEARTPPGTASSGTARWSTSTSSPGQP